MSIGYFSGVAYLKLASLQLLSKRGSANYAPSVLLVLASRELGGFLRPAPSPASTAPGFGGYLFPRVATTVAPRAFQLLSVGYPDNSA